MNGKSGLWVFFGFTLKNVGHHRVADLSCLYEDKGLSNGAENQSLCFRKNRGRMLCRTMSVFKLFKTQQAALAKEHASRKISRGIVLYFCVFFSHSLIISHLLSFSRFV